MKLILKRSQRSSGMLGNKVAFGLNARIDLTPEERNNIAKYRLGSEIVYSSEALRKHVDTMQASAAGQVGLLRGFAAMAAATLSLKCTIDSLAAGQYIECKDLPELLAAEGAVRRGCETHQRAISQPRQPSMVAKRSSRSEVRRPTVYTPFHRWFSDERGARSGRDARALRARAARASGQPLARRG